MHGDLGGRGELKNYPKKIFHCVLGGGSEVALSLGWHGAEQEARMCKADSFPALRERMLRNDRGTPNELVSSSWKVFFFFFNYPWFKLGSF